MKRLDAPAVYLIYSIATSLFFAIIFTVNLVYQVTMVGLNPLQLVLVGTVLETSVFLFEIPTGVVADVFSRRLSVTIGVLLIGLGFIVEGAFPHFGTVLLGQVLWGLGFTFTSGASDAWIADEVGEDGIGKVFLRGSQAGVVGSLLGAVVSMGLGSIRVNVPIVVGGVLFILLGAFLILAMPEHGFTPKVRKLAREAAPPVTTPWRSMLHVFRSGLKLIRGRPTLVTILSIGLFFGLYSEGFDRLWTPHLIQDIHLPTSGGLTPVIWFGAINVLTQLFTLGSTELARRKWDPDNARVSLWALFANSAVLLGGLLVFAITLNFALALGSYWVISISRKLNGPYFTAWVNRHLTSDVRATVLSMSSQVDAFGQIVGGPILGVIGTAISIPAALIGSAVFLSPVLGLFMRTVRKENQESVENKQIEG